MIESSKFQATKLNCSLYDRRQNRFIPIWDGISIGRTKGDVVFPEDTSIDELQFRISIRGENLFIESLGNNFSTKVSGFSLSRGQTRKIRPYETIEVGDKVFLLSIDEKIPPSYSSKVESPGNLADLAKAPFVAERPMFLDSQFQIFCAIGVVSSLFYHSELGIRAWKLHSKAEIETSSIFIWIIGIGLTVFLAFALATYFQKIHGKNFQTKVMASIAIPLLQYFCFYNFHDILGTFSKLRQQQIISSCIKKFSVIDCSSSLQLNAEEISNLPPDILSQIQTKIPLSRSR